MAVVALSEADNGRSIAVRPGDEIRLRLPENPTTGFRWEVEQADPIVESTDDRFELDRDPQIGSGGTRDLRYRVSPSPAVGRLALRLWQRWEGEASVSERFSVELRVET